MTDNYALLADFEAELVHVTSERARLDKREAALRKTIAGLRELISLNGGTPPASPTSEVVIPPNHFDGLTITDAATEYLLMAGKPQTNRQIVEALTKGGITSTAKDFSSTVRAILLREHEKPDGTLVWDVPNWYLREWKTQNK